MNPSNTEDVQVREHLREAFVSLSRNSDIWHADLKHAVETISRTCGRVMHVERTSVWLLNNSGGSLVCQTLYLASRNEFSRVPRRTATSYPTYFQAISSESVIAAHDATADPRTAEFIEAYTRPLGIGAILDAAIHYESDSIGFLCLEHVGSSRRWTDEEQSFAASVSDLLSRLVIFHRLRESEMRYRSLFETVGDGIFVLNKGTIVDCNSAAMNMLGVERHQIINRSAAHFSPALQADGQASGPKAEAKIQAAEQGEGQCFEWRCQTLAGEIIETEVTLNATQLAGKPVVFALVRDITARKQAREALLRSKQEMEHRAHHDSLTGLPNRGRLHDMAALAIEAAQTDGRQLSLMLLDLDRFKEVNDTLGHHMGDTLLKQLAQRLQALLLQHRAQLYRLGGDEFAILVPELSQPQDALRIGEAASNSLRSPFALDGVTLELSGSIGIAIYPKHGDNSHVLLRCADVAMYNAKSRATGLSVYEPELDSHSPKRLAIIGDLGSAIRQNQLLLMFQPRIEIATGRCVGCEALVRWPHTQFGLIPPTEFIPLAEMGELMRPLTLWVIGESLTQIKRWSERNIHIPVAINLSVRNLLDTAFPKQVKQLLDGSGVPAAMLEFEITESALLSDPHRASRIIEQLSGYGVRFAIDNFGTGYSSLSDLKRLSVGVLKIDNRFIKRMLHDPQDNTIVQTVIDLGHRFGMKVVAEGVETAEILDALRQNRCDDAQGFFFCKPMASADIPSWLNDHNGKEYRRN